LTASLGSNDLAFFSNYYGHYKAWWTNTGALSLSGIPMIAYSGGGALAGSGGSSGSVVGNPAIGFNGASQPTSAAPLEFSFGALLSAVSDGGSCAGGTAGLVCLTASLSTPFSNVSNGQKFQINNVTNLSAGPWPVTKLDSQHIQLQGPTFSGTMAVVGGGPGTQSEAIAQVGNLTWSFPAQGTFSTNYSNFTGMVICRSQNVGFGGLSDCANIGSHYANPDYVSSIKTDNPRWVRWMDQTSVQNSFATSFGARPTTTQFSWGVNNFVPGYWTGLITNTSDALVTASNPANSPSSGGPVDGEIVIGYISAANTTTVPTLAVNRTSFGSGRPICSSGVSGLSLTMSGSVPATGTTISFVFTGGGLTSPFTYNYVTSTSVNGPGGVLDTSFNNIAINIRADINNNTRGNSGALVTAHIVSENPAISNANMTFDYNPNINSSGVAALGNGLTITGSDSASSGVYNFGFVPVSYLSTNGNATFTYSAIAGCWIGANNGTALPGPHGGPPLEFYEDFSLQANIGAYINLPILYSDTAIYNTTLHLANSGVKELVLAVSNEMWNTGGGGQWGIVHALGDYYGFPSTFNGGYSYQAYAGLRIYQLAVQARQAWSDAGRNPAQLHISNEYMFVRAFDPVADVFNGTHLNPSSNVTLAAYGGSPSNGTTTPGALSTNLSAFPNRPIDWSDSISPAPYFEGTQFNSIGQGFAPNINTGVPLSAYNCSLIAGYNYVNGNSTEQSAALDFMFNGTSGDFYDHFGLVKGTVTGSVTGSVLNVTSVSGFTGSINVGNSVGLSGVADQNQYYIASDGTGGGGTGTYNLNQPGSVGSTSIAIGSVNGSGQLATFSNTSLVASSANYFGAASMASAYDSTRTGTNPHTGVAWLPVGVTPYEGDAQAGPITSSDISTVNGNLVGLGDTNGYTSGLGTFCGLTPHPGGPASTVGTAAGADANNMAVLLLAFKNDNRYKLLYLQYFNDFVASMGSRVAVPATYGFEGSNLTGGTWSKYPGNISATPFQSLNAIQQFNFLLKRDLDPASNDNDPMWLEKAA
jgi:hypothetical protein